jgi:hypothetical protein
VATTTDLHASVERVRGLLPPKQPARAQPGGKAGAPKIAKRVKGRPADKASRQAADKPKVAERSKERPAEQASGQAAAQPKVPGRIEGRLGALPWWAISAAIHAVLFLLVALLAVAVAPPRVDEVVISTDVVKQKPPEYDPIKKRDLFKNPKDVQADTQVDNPVITHEKMAENDHFETDNNSDKNTSRGNEEAISDIPLGGTGAVGSVGVGSGGMAGVFGYRDGGGRKKATVRFGGSEATESSVEAALQWLKRHQEKEGYWDAPKWQEMGGFFWGFGQPGAAQRPAMERTNVAMTGMAMLAFLGAGYTSKSGKYKEVVEAAEKWLLSVLDDRANGTSTGNSGGNQKYGSFDECNYTQGMATLAIAEAFGMTRDPVLKKAAQAAVDTIVARQGKYEAWDYRDKTGKAGRNDTSVTGWNLMALKSAKMAGLTVDGNAFQGCMQWLDAATDPANGKCSYSGTIGGAAAGRFPMQRGIGSEAMWAAGMLMRQFMGAPQNDPILLKAAETIDQNQPKWDVTVVPGRTIPARVIPARTIPARTIGNVTIPEQNIPEQRIPEQVIPETKTSRSVNFYYWYYATLCMFQIGDQHWKTWNANMKSTLVDNQRKGGPLDGTKQDVDGSWDPIGGGSVPFGGRVFSTALGALTLEVYYRYLPIYSK